MMASPDFRKMAERGAKKNDPQYALAQIQVAMDCVGISQCALDVADEAVKRLAERDRYQRALIELREKLGDVRYPPVLHAIADAALGEFD